MATKDDAMYRGNSHKNGGIDVVVDGEKPIEVEGNEYKICRAAYNSPEVISRTGTNKQVLDFIHGEFSCSFEQGKADSGDFILCKLVVLDTTTKKREGTVKQILDEMQAEKNCRISNQNQQTMQTLEKGGQANVEAVIKTTEDAAPDKIQQAIEKIASTREWFNHLLIKFLPTIKRVAPANSTIFARTKTTQSILNKLVEKRMIDSECPKRGLTDLIGFTIAVNSFDELKEVRKDIEGGALGEVVETEDMYETPKGGYRAIHFIIWLQTENGRIPVEVQLKTRRMKSLNELSHEPYKRKLLNTARMNELAALALKADEGDFAAQTKWKEVIADEEAVEKSLYTNQYAFGGRLHAPNEMNVTEELIAPDLPIPLTYEMDFHKPQILESAFIEILRNNGASHIISSDELNGVYFSYLGKRFFVFDNEVEFKLDCLNPSVYIEQIDKGSSVKDIVADIISVANSFVNNPQSFTAEISPREEGATSDSNFASTSIKEGNITNGLRSKIWQAIHQIKNADEKFALGGGVENEMSQEDFEEWLGVPQSRKIKVHGSPLAGLGNGLVYGVISQNDEVAWFVPVFPNGELNFMETGIPQYKSDLLNAVNNFLAGKPNGIELLPLNAEQVKDDSDKHYTKAVYVPKHESQKFKLQLQKVGLSWDSFDETERFDNIVFGFTKSQMDKIKDFVNEYAVEITEYEIGGILEHEELMSFTTLKDYPYFFKKYSDGKTQSSWLKPLQQYFIKSKSHLFAERKKENPDAEKLTFLKKQVSVLEPHMTDFDKEIVAKGYADGGLIPSRGAETKFGKAVTQFRKPYAVVSVDISKKSDDWIDKLTDQVLLGGFELYVGNNHAFIISENGSVDAVYQKVNMVRETENHNYRQAYCITDKDIVVSADDVEHTEHDQHYFGNGGKITATKAKQILSDGTAHGHPLTAKQKRYFGWIAGGRKEYGSGGSIEEVEPLEMTEDDCSITSNGFKYSVACGGKFINEFDEMTDALKAVEDWKEENKWYCTTWFVSDHGNAWMIDEEGNEIKYAHGGGVQYESTKRTNNSPLLEYVNFYNGSHINLVRLIKPFKNGYSYGISVSSIEEGQKVFLFKNLKDAENSFNERVSKQEAISAIVKRGKLLQNYEAGGTIQDREGNFTVTYCMTDEGYVNKEYKYKHFTNWKPAYEYAQLISADGAFLSQLSDDNDSGANSSVYFFAGKQIDGADAFVKGGEIGTGKNKFLCRFRGKEVFVWANGAYQAQEEAAKYFKAKKSYEISTRLVEEGGKQVIQDFMFSKGGNISLSASSYKNDFELNKAIERLIDQKNSDKPEDYTSDEKRFISLYSGMGGLEKQGATGKGLLWEYFTPDAIVQKMWALAYKNGFKGGNVLEPSAGVGAFIKYAGENCHVEGFEINKYSYTICRILFPAAKIYHQAFEQRFIENNDTVRGKVFNSTKYSQVGYDLIIGNPPYGDFTGKWAGMGEQQYTKAQTYVEYFITRGLDLVVSGGLLIYIVGVEVANGGKPFLAQGMTKAKEAIAEKAEILEAYRLPNGVFDRTDVVTDIIVLRKK